ncbi:MAG: hypothetical protein WBK43_12470 [Prolixibacteraceae bacterium]|jgi:hypothetical protein|nr:hypothetical protein [Prolixibacteraceae bacterium]MDI9564612.1 hypothetical protein [Bacteroidota bacterium]NLT00594.1 hypothetical protein [Bacteroidales bacterium]HNU78971.1 hypothetical protein [Prolixibacteraceae bacterium]HNZ68325.1 hypothetical protein [Prolixibacteraceae bacterium]
MKKGETQFQKMIIKVNSFVTFGFSQRSFGRKQPLRNPVRIFSVLNLPCGAGNKEMHPVVHDAMPDNLQQTFYVSQIRLSGETHLPDRKVIKKARDFIHDSSR